MLELASSIELLADGGVIGLAVGRCSLHSQRAYVRAYVGKSDKSCKMVVDILNRRRRRSPLHSLLLFLSLFPPEKIMQFMLVKEVKMCQECQLGEQAGK